MLDGSNKVLEIAVEASKTPEAIRGIPQSLDFEQDRWSDRSGITEEIAEAVPMRSRVQRRRKKRSRQVPGKPCAWFAAGTCVAALP